MEIKDQENQFEIDPITVSDDKLFFVIVGANNSGKSTLLRSIHKTKIATSYMVDVNRTILRGEGAIDKSYQSNYNAYIENFRNVSDDNSEKSIQSLQDFFKLDDEARKPIIEWYNKYFPNQIYEERENPSNSASPLLLKVNSNSITKQGSGMRSTLEIFIRLFDRQIEVLCIDEPELGLEPFLQKYLFQAIKDKASSNKKIFLATHSHHFLDYDEVQNNYACTRSPNGKLNITVVRDLQPVIFRLLGNTLASLLLPENVIVLEGTSDTTYLSKCLTLLNKQNYAVHNSGSDSSIKYAVNAITQFLKFNQKSLPVYRDNIFVIADKQMNDINLREWKLLLRDEKKQLKVLSKNGIEYFYPEGILKNIFNTNESKDNIVSKYLTANPNSFNGVRLTKIELAQIVASQLNSEHLMDSNNELFSFLYALP